MSDAKSQAEPSMEEILASIRRIISEDAASGQNAAPSAATLAASRPAAVPAAGREREDVLNLTQPLDGDDELRGSDRAARSISAAAIKNAALEASRTIERPEKVDLDLNFELDPSLEADDDASSFEEDSFESGLLSRAAAGATSDALSRLDQAMVAPPSSERQKKPAAPSPSFSGGMTIEQLVAETLKPILRDWLNDNLPSMVEEMVQAEIHRLTQSRRR